MSDWFEALNKLDKLASQGEWFWDQRGVYAGDGDLIFTANSSHPMHDAALEGATE